MLGLFACTNPDKGNTEGNDTSAETVVNTVVIQTPMALKIDSVSKYISQNPNDAEAYHRRAKLYYKERNINYAQADIEKALSIDSLNSAFYLTNGQVMFARKKSRLAKESWEKCVKYDSKNINCRLKLAEMYSSLAKELPPNSSEFIKSMQLLTKVLEIDSENEVAYYYIGVNYMYDGDTSKAITNLQQAVQYDQQFVTAFELLGALYAGKGDPLAENYYNIAIDIAPNNASIYHNLGVYYKDVNEFDKSIQAYTKAVQIDPSYTQAHYALGYLHYELNVIDVAIMHFTNALESNQRDYRSYFGRGLCYERVGDIAKAEQDYRKCLELWQYEPAIEALSRVTRGNQQN